LAEESSDRQGGDALLVVLDSLGNRQDEAIGVLLQYLDAEWKINLNKKVFNSVKLLLLL
jgi:hypothetical protein